MSNPSGTIKQEDLKNSIGQSVIVIYSDGSRRVGKIAAFDDKNKKIRIERHKDHFWIGENDKSIQVLSDLDDNG